MNQCRNGCGIEIQFDPTKKSASGKMIPLEYDGNPHKCPNSKYYSKPTKVSYGFEFSAKNGFATVGDFIVWRNHFCKCGIYNGPLVTGSGFVTVQHIKP